MAHPHKAEAKASHGRKLESYGAKAQGSKFDDKGRFAGSAEPIGTDEQAGLEIINEKPSLSKKTMDRIMRKRGGMVHGKEAVKRLDKGARKGRKAYQTGGGDQMPSAEESMRSAERLHEIRRESTDSDTDKRAMPPASEAAKRSGKFQNYKKGGKVSHMEWEHSKKDLEQDKKLAKKHGMSMEKWEKSALDKKHDKQQSTEGLKKGGRAKYERGGGDIIPSESDIQALNRGRREAGYEDQMEERGFGNKIPPKAYRKGNLGEGEYAMKKGGVAKVKSYIPENLITKSARAARKDGGPVKGRTSVNIVIAPSAGQPQGGMPMPMPMPPRPMAAPPAPAPMMGGAPGMPPGGAGMPMGGGMPMAGGMPPMPPMAGAGPGMPLPRKKGGRVNPDVPVKTPGRTSEGYAKMDYGAVSGQGRRQKILAQE